MRWRAYLLSVVLLLAQSALATEFSFPIELPQALIEAMLRQQLIPDPDSPLTIATDDEGCGEIELNQLNVDTRDEVGLQLTLNMRIRAGTPVLGRCVTPFVWQGRLELLESVYRLDATTVGMSIVDSHLKPAHGDRINVPDLIWNLVKRFVHPRIESLRLDLRDVTLAASGLLALIVAEPGPEPPRVEILGIDVGHQNLELELGVNLPSLIGLTGEQAEFSAQEITEWDSRWQAWDAFATWLVKSLLTNPSDETLRRVLQETLLDARYALREALVGSDYKSDPVRELFLRSWERLQPIVRSRPDASSAATGLQVLGFVAAGDALAAAERATSGIGLQINQQSLRYLVRLLQPAAGHEVLDYSLDVDPPLRLLLGFSPELEISSVRNFREPFHFQLIRSAWAEQENPMHGSEPEKWLPVRGELYRYLEAVEHLIARVADGETRRNKIGTEYQRVYSVLLRATAWQETCWRQFVMQEGQIQTIRSGAGSVGLMQVNKHVWRGVYDLQRLESDINYNAWAGNEILVHYLVDYAIRKREHQFSGGLTNLARATYAAYNGGPGHLGRYRNPKTSQHLAAIDSAFWSKYQAIEREGFEAVKQCFGS